MRGSTAFRAAVAPGGVLAAPWVKNELWRRARAVPSLDLRFAENKSLVDATTGAQLVTFTRASSGTFVGSDGLIRTAVTNEARFDHNPATGESLGLLVEEQRTNSVRNNTMVGAVAGTPGTNPANWGYVTTQSNGLTQTIVGTGTENGINYIDYRFNGTTVASPNAIAFGIEGIAGVAATGQTWTAAIYLRLANGTLTGVNSTQIGLIENTSGGSFVSGALYTISPPTSAALIRQRATATKTLSGGATVGVCALTLNINVAGNTAIDFTLRIGLPQLEQGAFATSVIPTSGTAVTRAADVASISGSNFSSWYRQDEGTVFAGWQLNAGSISQARHVSNINNLPGTDQATLFVTAVNSISQNTFISGISQGRLDSGTLASFTPYNSAFSYSFSGRAFTTNGANVSAGTGTVQTATRIEVGNYNGGSNLNGTIRRLVYWGQRLPNSVLQAITQ